MDAADWKKPLSPVVDYYIITILGKYYVSRLT